MNIEEILKSDLVQFPKSWKNLNYKSYPECIYTEGLKYLKLLESLDDGSFEIDIGLELKSLTKRNLIDASKNMHSAVLETLEVYLDKGSPFKAYETFEKHFQIKKDHELNYLQPLHYLDYIKINSKDDFYKIRVSEYDLKIEQIFHVPFKDREKIKSYRYSISGFPTLYLSNLLFISFNEIGINDYDRLYVSKFKFVQEDSIQNNHLLDLRGNFPYFAGERAIMYLVRWPLIMACNIKVAYPNSPFKPEYIIPQIVFQWVRNNISFGGNRNKILGVAYSSSKSNNEYDGEHYNFSDWYYNVAIPTVSKGKNDFCNNLSKQFVLTKPFNFKSALNTKAINPKEKYHLNPLKIFGANIKYSDSDFGKIEIMLNSEIYSNLYFINGEKYIEEV